MDKEYIEEYIQTLSSRDHVRLRPNLYFQKCFENNTLDSLPFEVACQAFDEYFDKNCKTIIITVSECSFSIQYDAGMSLEYNSHGQSIAELIMTQLFACRNKKKHLSVGEEFCTLGIATINYVSELCELTTVSQKSKGLFIFKRGIISSCSIINTDEEDFTTIFIKPDKAIFQNLKITFDGVESIANEIKSKLSNLNIEVRKSTL